MARSVKGSVNETEIEKVLFELFLDTLSYNADELADFAI
jgi:hypothetical protein